MTKHILGVYLFLFICMAAYAGGPSRWAKTLQIRGGATIYSIEQSFDGGFIVAGTNSVSPPSAVLVRLDSLGNMQWTKRYFLNGATAQAGASTILQTPDGGFVFAGYIYNRTDGSDALVVKVDASGRVVWQKAYGDSSSYDEATAIVPAADGGFFLFGNTGSEFYDVWCMKLSSKGKILWKRAYGSKDFDEGIMNAIATQDGGIVFLGNTGDFTLIVKLNHDGDILWQKTFRDSDSQGSFLGSTLAATVDGGYLVGAIGWVMKLDKKGNLIWQTALHHPQSDRLAAIQAVRQEEDGHVLVMGFVGAWVRCGYFCVRLVYDNDIWTARLDSNGKMFWQRAFGESDITGYDWFSAIHETPNDGTVLAAQSGHILFAQTSPDGMVCSALREKSLRISSDKASVSPEKAPWGEIKTTKNRFVVKTTHLTEAALQFQVHNLCENK
jgi:hypothetical protein